MLGKQVFKRTPSVFHSELGGRYTKQFLRRNRQLAQHVPGMRKGRLSGVVRAHDTDIHKFKPWTQKWLINDRAAGTTYLADKAEGLGRMGAERTVSMAKKFKETIPETMRVADKNVAKYRGVINRYATPGQAQQLTPRLGRYQNQMRYYGQHGVLPKVAGMQKEAMGIDSFVQILSRIGRDNPVIIKQMLKKVLARSPEGKSEIVQAIYKLPANKRMDALNIVSTILK